MEFREQINQIYSEIDKILDNFIPKKDILISNLEELIINLMNCRDYLNSEFRIDDILSINIISRSSWTHETDYVIITRESIINETIPGLNSIPLIKLVSEESIKTNEPLSYFTKISNRLIDSKFLTHFNQDLSLIHDGSDYSLIVTFSNGKTWHYHTQQLNNDMDFAARIIFDVLCDFDFTDESDLED